MTTALIVGASLAGLRAAESLREQGFAGRIVVLGEERHRPYDRPPLSKKFLSGEWNADRIALRRPEVLAALDVEWMLGRPAVGLNGQDRQVVLDDGSCIDFDGLVIATGCAARRLSGQPELEGVHALRTLDDAEQLRRHLRSGARVVVVGAGFIGLEAAATARQLGADVVVLEGLDAPLARALGTQMGTAIGEVHVHNGVQVRCGVAIGGLVGSGHVQGVELRDGELVGADMVVVGIGVSPSTEWLTDSGVSVSDGVVCDEFLSTGIPGVFAAGDIVRWPNRLFTDVEPLMRVEHWTNAAEQGAHAGRNLAAWFNRTDPMPYEAVPFFWSDQFDMRIQFLGRALPGSRTDLVGGDPKDGKWCCLYSSGERVTGVLGVSMPKLVMPSRSLLSRRASLSEALDHFSSAR